MVKENTGAWHKADPGQDKNTQVLAAHLEYDSFPPPSPPFTYPMCPPHRAHVSLCITHTYSMSPSTTHSMSPPSHTYSICLPHHTHTPCLPHHTHSMSPPTTHTLHMSPPTIHTPHVYSRTLVLCAFSELSENKIENSKELWLSFESFICLPPLLCFCFFLRLYSLDWPGR